MAEKLENHQHQDECVEEPEQKRPKPDECESSANAVETKKITNIYYDCLERIFDFLDLKSLLMVAQTCKRLQIAAAVKFGDEFGKTRVWLYPPKIILREEEIIGLKFYLAFLRCFGGKISDLCVFYNYLNSKEGHLDQYINLYCATTLINIDFRDKSQFSTEAFEKPFKNVQIVEVTNCHFRNQLRNFVIWFPNLRHLDIYNCSFDKTAPMNVSFPHLEYLRLNINNSHKQAANLWQANPQLKSLKNWWKSDLSLSTVLDTIGANSLITKLEVEIMSIGINSIDVNMGELNRFVAEHQLVEELVMEDHRLAASDAINFIRQMKSLKRIRFQVMDRPECDRIEQELNNGWKSNVSIVVDKFYIKLNRWKMDFICGKD